VAAYVVDLVPGLVALAFFLLGYLQLVLELIRSGGKVPVPANVPGLTAMLIGLVVAVPALAWQIYNRWILAGRTGQSVGKRLLGIRLVSEDTGRPIGALNAFIRDLVHYVDAVACVGYLWPLWDPQRRTFADMIVRTLVVESEPHDQRGAA